MSSILIPGAQYSNPVQYDLAQVQKQINSILNSYAQFAGQVGFYGSAPTDQAGGFTINYTTFSRTFSGYTSNTQSSAYSGVNNAQSGTVYAQVSDLNNLRVAYENLRVGYEGLLGIVNQLIKDMKTYGLEK